MNRRERIVTKLAHWLGIDVKAYAQNLALWSGTELPKEYIDPVPKIHELQDDPCTCYIWQMLADTDDYKMRRSVDEMYSEFVKKYGRDPNALHLVVNNIEDIHHMNQDALERIIVPWAKKNNR